MRTYVLNDEGFLFFLGVVDLAGAFIMRIVLSV